MTTGDSRGPIGTTIAGRYQLRAVLGRGGMATVYRAYQPALDREVAVKLIDPHLESDPQFGERFRLEARIVARLRHPNILTIYDFGEEGGLLYLVTELIQGGTLQARLGEIRSFAQALDIVEQVGRALDYAHAQGIVHRDVKPANVFLDGDRAILADFGIAKIIAGVTDAGLTATGAGIGTAEYMAPEQLLGQQLDGRADLYALAVLFYRLVAGRLPYRLEGPQDTTLALVMRKVNGPPPPPSAFNPVVTPTLDAILLRALERDPQARYPTAAALTATLRGALGLGSPRPTGPVAPAAGLHATATTSLPTIAGPPSQPQVTSPTPVTPLTPPAQAYQPAQYQQPQYQQPAYQPPAYQRQPHQQPSYLPPTEQQVAYPPVPPRRAAPVGLLAILGVLAVLLIAVAAGAFVLSRNLGGTTGRGGDPTIPPSATVPIGAGVGGPSPSSAAPPTNTPVPPPVVAIATPPTPTTAPPTVTPTVPPPTEVPPTEVPPTEVPPTDVPPTPTPTVTPRPPTPTPTVPPPTATPPPPAANVRAVAEQAILSLPGTSSGVFINLANGADNYADDPDRVMPAASMIKLPIAGAAYQRVANGQWQLNDTFTLTNAAKVGGTGILQNQPAGSTYTLDELVEIMLVYSDNTAANMILDRLGGFDVVNAFSASQGMNNTVMRRRLFDLASQQRGVDNTTTSGDIARFMSRLQAGQVVNRTASDRIRTILARRGREDKNWALLNLPANVVALHISGTGAGNRNDAIVVTVGNQQYILVLMVVSPGEAAMEQAIARASASIYQAMVGR